MTDPTSRKRGRSKWTGQKLSRQETSGHEPQTGLDTKTDRHSDWQSVATWLWLYYSMQSFVPAQIMLSPSPAPHAEHTGTGNHKLHDSAHCSPCGRCNSFAYKYLVLYFKLQLNNMNVTISHFKFSLPQMFEIGSRVIRVLYELLPLSFLFHLFYLITLSITKLYSNER
jgi:hypothetical protein